MLIIFLSCTNKFLNSNCSMRITQDGIAKKNKKQGGKEPGEAHTVPKSWPISSTLVPHLFCTVVANSSHNWTTPLLLPQPEAFLFLSSLVCVGSTA